MHISYHQFVLRFIFSFLLLTGFFISSAQNTPKVWTLEDCVNYALDHNLITSSSADARLYSKITRKELAKIIAVYAKNVI